MITKTLLLPMILTMIFLLSADVKSLQANTSRLLNSVSRIDRSVLNIVIKLGGDEKALTGVENDVSTEEHAYKEHVTITC